MRRLGSPLLIVAILAAACAERGHPGASSVSSNAAPSSSAPAPSVAAAVPAAIPAPTTSAATERGAPALSSAAPPAVSAAAGGASGVTAEDDALAERNLLAPDGTPLPQTEARPAASSALFQRRMQLLAEAITKDDPSIAHAAFFPVVAYAQVKAVAKPERDWRFRLMKHFERDIHEYHRLLGADAEQAKLSGVDVNEAQARWMKPGSEGNRLGYYRVLRSRLRFTTAAGKNRDFELTSLISWRGEWYVVHLHGFE